MVGSRVPNRPFFGRPFLCATYVVMSDLPYPNPPRSIRNPTPHPTSGNSALSLIPFGAIDSALGPSSEEGDGAACADINHL